MGDVRRKFEVAFGSLGAKDLDTEIKGADKSLADLEARGKSVAKTLQAASKKTEQAESSIVAAARKNAERRVKLLEDENQKRVQLLDLRQEREVEAARRRNENLADLEAFHAKQRQELDEKLAQAAEREAERRAKAEERAQRQARQRELSNLEAQARAIEDAGERELALLDVRHQKEMERARQQGRDLAALQAAQTRERADAVGRVEQKAVEEATDRQKDLADAYDETGDASEGLGSRLGGLNDDVRESLGGFGDMLSRLGEIEDVAKILSGFAFVELGGAVLEVVQAVYQWTDAGKQAQRMAEAQEGAINSLTSAFDRLLEARRLNSRVALQLTNAEAGVAFQTAEYTALIEKRRKQDERLADLIRRRSILEQELGAALAAQSSDVMGLTVLIEDETKAIANAEAQLIDVGEALEQARKAQAGVNKEIDESGKTWGRYAHAITSSTRSIVGHFEAQARYRFMGGTGPVEGTIDLLASFAKLGVDAYGSVTKKVEAYTKATRKAGRATADIDDLAWVNALLKFRMSDVGDALGRLNDISKNIVAAQDRDALRQVELGGGDVEFAARLQALKEQYGAEMAVAVEHGDNLALVTEIYQHRVTRAIEEGTERRLAAQAAAQDRDALRQTELDGGDVELASKLQALRTGYEAELQVAAEHGDNVVFITKLYQRRVTEAIEEGTERRLAAQAAEVEASAGQVVQLGRAAHSLAKNVGASKGLLAGIERVMELAMAAKEIAAGVGSAARGDILGAAVHFTAATAHGVAAAKFGEVPGSKSGGGSAPAPPQYSRVTSSSPTSNDLPRNRSGGGQGGSSTTIHIYGATDPRGARDAIATDFDQRGYGEVRLEQGAA